MTETTCTRPKNTRSRTEDLSTAMIYKRGDRADAFLFTTGKTGGTDIVSRIMVKTLDGQQVDIKFNPDDDNVLLKGNQAKVIKQIAKDLDIECHQGNDETDLSTLRLPALALAIQHMAHSPAR